jgi:hypothetical protein
MLVASSSPMAKLMKLLKSAMPEPLSCELLSTASGPSAAGDAS